KDVPVKYRTAIEKTNRPYQITLTRFSIIQKCRSAPNTIPNQPIFNFVPLKDVFIIGIDEYVDVMGVITRIGPSTPFQNQNGDVRYKRNVSIMDRDKREVRVTFWDSTATAFKGKF